MGEVPVKVAVRVSNCRTKDDLLQFPISNLERSKCWNLMSILQLHIKADEFEIGNSQTALLLRGSCSFTSP